jgi:hypothetical protein
MSLSIAATKELAMLGCNITLSIDNGYGLDGIKELALIMRGKRSHLTLYSSRFSLVAMKEIIMIAPGQITMVV